LVSAYGFFDKKKRVIFHIEAFGALFLKKYGKFTVAKPVRTG
jgi:hypothetical protein